MIVFIHLCSSYISYSFLRIKNIFSILLLTPKIVGNFLGLHASFSQNVPDSVSWKSKEKTFFCPPATWKKNIFLSSRYLGVKMYLVRLREPPQPKTDWGVKGVAGLVVIIMMIWQFWQLSIINQISIINTSLVTIMLIIRQFWQLSGNYDDDLEIM